MSVTAQVEPLTLPTYPVGAPEKNPVFFEKRVYQGSCGKVYPVPFIDKVHDQPEAVEYRSVRLENEYVRLVLLPEIGGRVWLGQDKTNRDYDFFYRQDVVKPALVGLAGPWISGGVEFNWPQHHRPGTFLPADLQIEEEEDGARTVWLSEHDPLNRLKGMHGLRLRPGSALIELRVRLYNRTPLTHTFLWWANVAARVHDRYQSFFPPDVRYVADHAVRAMSSFPVATGPYYGVPYQDRPGTNDLTWYRNIPVPTSYMVCQTGFDFFGGYDHEAGGGFVHVADRHIAPGKKQWTWGNHAFGYAWDRELTDANGPYIELMAGAYTDNQPDFSYLLPGETKKFSQFWWPIQRTGPVQAANRRAALRLVVTNERTLELAAAVAEPLPGARLVLTRNGAVVHQTVADLAPGSPWAERGLRFDGDDDASLELALFDRDGAPVIRYQPVATEGNAQPQREVASEPPAPDAMQSADELFFTGEHLEQYRHPTRDPQDYWREALRRDPHDARCRTALGRAALRRGELAAAVTHLEAAVARLTRRHPNPVTGEAHYFLGLALRLLGRDDEAYARLAKAAWNYEWRSAARYQLAVIDCRRRDWRSALDHTDAALDTNRDHNQAQALRAAVLRRAGCHPGAKAVLGRVLGPDPLDHWARYEQVLLAEASGQGDADALRGSFLARCRNDAQTLLDLAFDYADAGLRPEAIGLLDLHHAHPVVGAPVPNPLQVSPATRYTLAWLLAQEGETGRSQAVLAEARQSAPDYFFPSRLHEQLVLEWALSCAGPDPLAAYGLGNYCFDRKRHGDALARWERAREDAARTGRAEAFATVHRNLGIGYWNIRRDGPAARASYRRALELNPADARLVAEADQLAKKCNDPLADRLAFLEARRALVAQRDDATVEQAALLNLSNRPAEALELLLSRRFHPWEGGEGAVLRQYTQARTLLGRQALEAGDAAGALAHFTGAMATPGSLGEAYHLLQAKADVEYWTGKACQALGRAAEARQHFRLAAGESGDFSEMAVTEHSPLSYYRGLALRELGETATARQLFASLREFASRRVGQAAAIDYFATSLPNLLVFEEDLQARRDAENNLLLALACHGLGDDTAAGEALGQALAVNRADPWAVDLARELAGGG